MCPTPRNPLEKQKEGIRNAGVVVSVTTNCITRARSIRPASTATDRVLDTVELLRNILNHSLRGQNCRNALVSRTWSDEALSVVWYRLESSLPLLTLLGPMSLQEEDGDLNFKYDRHIRPDDWIAFKRYSGRVRRIDYSDCHYGFSESVFIDIIATSALFGGELVPNLKHLNFIGCGPWLKFMPLFIPENLDSLELFVHVHEINDPLTTIYKPMLSYIPHKAPNLQHLSLISSERINTANELDLVLSTLPRLRKLHISSSQLVASTLDVTSRLLLLEEFQVDGADVENRIIHATTFLPDSFPSLLRFSTTAYRFDIIVSLLKRYKPCKLRSLEVHSNCKESSRAHRCLTEAIAVYCPAIQEIRLGSRLRLEHEPGLDQPSFPLDPLNYYHRSITSLELKYPPPLHLDVVSMMSLLSRLPSLVTLKLIEDTMAPTLPLSALSELAPLCPHMKALTLCVDTALLPTSTSPTARFRCLDVLNVGTSPLKSSALNVVKFLGAILPETCILERAFYHSAEDWEVRRAQYDKWQPIVDFLPLMLELRTAREAAAVGSTK